MNAARLIRLLICAECGHPLHFANGTRACCSAPGGATMDGNIVVYRPGIASPEMMARDRQASGYLQHAKFPTQIARLRRFIAGLPRANRPVLDLGCGPGPTTEMLAEKGFAVLAVDFSRSSLELNKAKSAVFVQADLREVRFANDSVDGLMMADFLQHLGDTQVQAKFLKGVFEALVPGGWFFLSSFNANLKNLLRRDIDGSFANGQIRYHRSTSSQILDILPAEAAVQSVQPMNVFHHHLLDDIVSRLPLARLLARMVVITGQKI